MRNVLVHRNATMKIAAITFVSVFALTLGGMQFLSYRQEITQFMGSRAEERPGSVISDAPEVELCDLLRNPLAYRSRTIRIESTMGRFRDYVTYYDPHCVPKHPLISVKFSPSIEWEEQSETGRKLQQIMTGTEEASDGRVHLFVSAVGRFEQIPRDQRSDFTELQYQFTVNKIEKLK